MTGHGVSCILPLIDREKVVFDGESEHRHGGSIGFARAAFLVAEAQNSVLDLVCDNGASKSDSRSFEKNRTRRQEATKKRREYHD